MPLTTQIGKAPEIYGFQTLHREIGYYISRLEQYDNSLKFFDEAIKKTPDDKRALIGRSKARSKVIQYVGALEDVNKALSLQPDDLVVLADKSLNTYLCCEFEEGLIQNTRLLPLRQKPDNFKMGVMQCTDAIENCLGERAGRPLRDYFKIIRRQAWKRNYAAQKPFEPKPTNASKKKKVMLKKLLEVDPLLEPVQPKNLKIIDEDGDNADLKIRDSLHSVKPNDEPIPPYTQPFPFHPLQRHTTNIENYMAEKYLNAMYLDKIFLKKITNEPGAKSPNEQGTKRIHNLAKSCFKTVHYKQEILRTRRPFYFIKYQEARISGALKDRQKKELELQQENTKKEADVLCRKMVEAYEQKELKLFLDLVEKLKKFCDKKPLKLLPTKEDYVKEIYEKVCNAFYDVYRSNTNNSEFQQTKRIYSILGLPLSRQPSCDSVVNQFKNVFLDYKKKVRDYSVRLENATSEKEACWYYHELSRFEFELGHFELSRLYAKKCSKTAERINNPMWKFNSAMLALKTNLAEHNKNDSKYDLLSALACAQALKDEAKIEYVEKCLGIIDQLEFEDVFGTKQLEKRENTIIQMMATSKMKDEVAHLFRQMSAMPASRRMTVMPGVRIESKRDDKKSARGRSMSIMPSAQQEKESVDPNVGTEGLKDLIELHL